MKTVKINASKKYDVKIGSGLLSNPGEHIPEEFNGRMLVIVSDDTVFSLYGEKLRDKLADCGHEVVTFVFPHGEQSKNFSKYGELLNVMCDRHVSRGDAVIALGGGVVGDLAGFAAATYQRGIGLIHMPTTLLAAVDSSVGGKTGIDLEGGKNQAGAFYQPSAVICDTDTLYTLPEEEYCNGCAEVIKYAVIGSSDMFEEILHLSVSEQYEDIIRKCVSMKNGFIEKDEYDLNYRMFLNFGHTIGHAVETCSNYSISHGKAVAIGMALITKAACLFGFCGNDTYNALIEMLKHYRLPFDTSFDREMLSVAALTDKKRSGDKITLVIPERIGKCKLFEIPKDNFPKWLEAGGAI